MRVKTLLIGILGLSLCLFVPAAAVQGSTFVIFATGVVKGADGAVVKNAAVSLLAWPPQSVRKTMKVGDSFKLVRVAETISGADGYFVLRVPETFDYRSITATPSDNFADFDIVAVTADSVGAYSFSRALSSSEAPAVPEIALQLLHQAGERPDALAGKTTPALSTVLTSSGACNGGNGELDQIYDPQWDLIGQVYNTVGGVAQTWSYEQGAESTLGVGVSASGNYGSFHASGSSSVSTDSLTTWPRISGMAYTYLDTEWQAGRYHIYCAQSGRGGAVKEDYYEVRAYDFAGGSQIRNIPSSYTPQATYCVKETAGSTFDKNTTTNITWSDGWHLGPVIGLDVETTSGYTTKTGIHFYFYYSYHLCGTNGYPGGTEQPPVRFVWEM